MVGRGAARLAADQVRIRLNWPCSNWPNAVSQNLACRSQDGSFVRGVNGDSADGGMPARKRAVSLALTASAAHAGNAAASNKLKATTAIFIGRSILVSGPWVQRADRLSACGRRRKSQDLKS